MAAAWPKLTERLIALLPTLPGWSAVTVYDGPPVTSDAPIDYITVGWVPGEDFAGSYEQARGVGNLLEENGSIRSELVCVDGGGDLNAVRDRAFALVDAWEQSLADDQTLGVLLPSSTASLSVDVEPAQTTAGAVQRLTVTLVYFARS